MIIRCERCSTLYELDEGLLAPDGSQVQCAKCQAIFLARPPRPAAAEPPAAAPQQAPPPAAEPAPTPEAPPVAAPPPAAPPALEPAARPARPAEPAPAAAAPSPERSQRGAPQRPTRPGPAVYRAEPPGARPARPTRRATLGPGPVRESNRSIALIAFAAVVVGLLVTGAWSLWRRGPDEAVGRLAAEAAARVAQDDSASLARAIQLYDELLGRAPTEAGAEVERAVARLLTAAGLQEEAEPLADRLSTNTVDRSQLDRERPPGSDEQLRALTAEATRLEAELAPRRLASEALIAQAAVELRTLAGIKEREALAARGLVIQATLAGDRAEVERLAPLASAAGPSPWPPLALAWIELRASGSRELAMSRLAELVKARPELLRARYLLAKAQAASGRQEEALSTLAGLLAANPRHERALRLQGQVAAAVAPPQGGAPAEAKPAAPARQEPPAPAAAPPSTPPAATQVPAPTPAATQPAASSPPPAPAAAQPQPQPAAPRPAAPQPAPQRPAPPPARPATTTQAPAQNPAPAAAPHPLGSPGGVLLPAPTRIEVTRPAVKAPNIDAGSVQPLASEPASPAKP